MKSHILNLIYKVAGLAGINILLSKKGTVRESAVKSPLGFWYIGNLFNRSDIAYGIFQNGQVEIEEGAVFSHLIDILHEKLDKRAAGLHIYDIGAHTGYYSLFSAIKDKQSTIYAFEPVAEYFEITKKNIELNNLSDRISAFKIGLSNQNDKAQINLAGSGSSLNTDMVSTGSTEEIDIRTLDSFIQEKNLAIPDLMKIDVESHELAMLEGMKETLAAHRPILFMEVIKLHQGKTNAKFDATFEFMKGLNYTAYSHSYRGEQNSPEYKLFDPKNTAPTAIENLAMYVFVPSEKAEILKLA